ncbi:MAG: HD domain-containing protein [Bacteroidota bacterium]
MPTYADAEALFFDWTRTASLRRHGLAVAASMARYAEHFAAQGEDVDVETWRITGLLHDLDYERHPTMDDHPRIGVAELERLGYPEVVRTAILGHAPYLGVPRESLLAKTLFAVDELSGFVMAVAFVRPTRMAGMKVKSVRKKLKDKAFAAAVSRDDIRQGIAELGVDETEHIARVIDALQREEARVFEVEGD